jgi:hypothetical protein
LIYDVVMFFVNNASRIAKFVDTILDSVADIVRGNIGGVVNKINDVLGQMVPIIIGFLASLIGLGGIGAKVREIIQKLQKPVNQAIDFVIKTGLKLAGPIIRGVAGVTKKVKAKFAAGKAWVKGKILGGDDSPEGKQQRLDKGMSAGLSVLKRFSAKPVAEKILKPLLAAIRVRYGMSVLAPEKRGERWGLHGVVNPERHDNSDAIVEEISDKILLESVTAMRTRVDDHLKEAEKASKRTATAVKKEELPASQQQMQSNLQSLRKAWSEAETNFNALGKKPARDQLVALRAVYIKLDTDVDQVMSFLAPSDTHLAGLNSARDSAKRSWSEIGKEGKKGKTAAALATPAYASIATEISTLGNALATAETAHQGIDVTNPAGIETLRGQYETLRATAGELLLTVRGISDPKALETERKRVVSKAQTAITNAQTAAETITARTGAAAAMVAECKALVNAVAAIPTPPLPAGLRAIDLAANTLEATTNRAAEQSGVTKRVDKQIAIIAEVIKETGLGGRPGATAGEGERRGTTEAAMDVEVATGQPLKSREGHHLKTVERMNQLVAAANELTALGKEKSATEADQAKITEALSAAKTRYLGLKSGLDAWEARAGTKEEPSERWHSRGTSKVLPTFPSQQTPEPKAWPE